MNRNQSTRKEERRAGSARIERRAEVELGLIIFVQMFLTQSDEIGERYKFRTRSALFFIPIFSQLFIFFPLVLAHIRQIIH